MEGIDRINNTALRNKLMSNDDYGIEKIFVHRYEGGQCEYGYAAHGTTYAWFGGDDEQEVDPETLVVIAETTGLTAIDFEA